MAARASDEEIDHVRGDHSDDARRRPNAYTSTLQRQPDPASSERPFIGAAATVEPTGDTSIRPFEFHASDEELADLKRRIIGDAMART